MVINLAQPCPDCPPSLTPPPPCPQSRECTQIFCKSFPSMKPGKAAALRAAQNGGMPAGPAGKIISRLPPMRKRKADDNADAAPPPPLKKAVSKTAHVHSIPAIDVHSTPVPVAPQRQVFANRIKDIGLAVQVCPPSP